MENKERFSWLKRLKPSTKELCFTVLVGAVLALCAVNVFKGDTAMQVSNVTPSEKEQKISRLLEEIEGVGEASVMICETEEGVQSVVVVCEGANNLQVILDVREAVAAALGTSQSDIRIYLKKS